MSEGRSFLVRWKGLCHAFRKYIASHDLPTLHEGPDFELQRHQQSGNLKVTDGPMHWNGSNRGILFSKFDQSL